MTSKFDLADLLEHLGVQIDGDPDVEPWVSDLTRGVVQHMPVLTWESVNSLLRVTGPYEYFETRALADFISWGAALRPEQPSENAAENWLRLAWEVRRMRYQDDGPSVVELAKLDAIAAVLDYQLRTALSGCAHRDPRATVRF